jgi:hypothetical protein
MAEVYDEAALEEALEFLYQEWGALGFWARRLHQEFTPGRKKYIGGVAAIRSALTSRTYGWFFLQKHKRLDLSIEQLALKPEWSHLFSDEDRKLARENLERISK